VSTTASREKYLERQRRYNQSEKGRARWRKYGTSPKKLEADRRYRETHYRLKVGDLHLGTYRLPDGLSKEQFLEMATEKRDELKQLYDEALA